MNRRRPEHLWEGLEGCPAAFSRRGMALLSGSLAVLFSASHTPCCLPQVDELMRQELRNLRLAVDKEEERPMKAPKA